jgi:hypothetical protein
MRRFDDSEGRPWEVVAGRESWGAIFAIFIPVEGDGGVRQTALKASSYDEANVELGRLSQASLRELLERSTPKDLE